MIPAAAPSNRPLTPAPARPAERRAAPPEALLDRPEFAVLPWIVLAVCLVAGALSEWLHGSDTSSRDWVTIYGALAGSVIATALAVAQHVAAVRRPRTSAWLYAGGTSLVMAGIAALAIRTDGLATPYYAGMLPLATYVAMIVPRRAHPWLAGTLFVVTATVQVVTPVASLFDAAVVWALVLAGWSCGVLGGLEHARVARIARRLADYDRSTRSLNRRAFLSHVERELTAPGAEHDPIAVLLLDLSGFGQVNATRGESAGDDVLEAVGATLARVLPEDAELGRLGDDQFAVLLPLALRNEAEAVGHRIRSFLHSEIDAAVGIATSQVRSLSTDDLMRVAEAALRVCKDDGLGLHVLVAGSTGAHRGLRAIPAGRPPLRYRQVRSTGTVPRAIGTLALYVWISTASFAVVWICGAIVIAAAWLGGGEGFAHSLVCYGGPAWLVWVAVLTGLTRVESFCRPGPRGWLLLANSTASVTIGICVAALADGGLAAPIIGALFVKVLFDAATLPAVTARLNVLLLLAGWAATAAVSPPETQYLIPFQLVLLGGCFALGAMSQRANGDMAEHARAVGHTDDLTGLANRAGFRATAEDAFLDSVTRTGAPFAVLWFQLEDPAQRPAASFAERDRLVRATAEAIAGRLPDAHVVARTGSLEFMAAVPRSGHTEALATARLAADQAGPLGITHVGAAACPDDGATVEALTRAATGLAPLTIHRSAPQPPVPARSYPGGPRFDRRAAVS